MVWLQRFMEELGKKQENNRLYYYSKSYLHLAYNSTFHSKTKHIKLSYHFILSILEDGHLKLEKIHTSQNPTDMLTNGVTREKLSSFLVSVGLQAWMWIWEIFEVQEGSYINKYNNGGVVEISLQVGDWWFVELDYLHDSKVFVFSHVYTPWRLYNLEECTLLHVGECRGACPPCRVWLL